MGVSVFPHILKKENEEWVEVIDRKSLQPKQIFSLNELFFNADLKKSLIQIANEDIDLSFFTNPNTSAYGNETNKNLTFDPKKVLSCVQKIKGAFEKNEETFIMPIQYKLLQSDSDEKIERVFIEFEVNGSEKKKQYLFGTVQIKNKDAKITFFDNDVNEWFSFNLLVERPNLYYAKLENREYIRGDKINWKVVGVRFYDQIKPELNHIEQLANYAIVNDYRMQIIYC